MSVLPEKMNSDTTRSLAGLRKSLDSVKLKPVSRLTKREQWVLLIVVGLLLTGWAVKTYRTAHPSPAMIQSAKP